MMQEPLRRGIVVLSDQKPWTVFAEAKMAEGMGSGMILNTHPHVVDTEKL